MTLQSQRGVSLSGLIFVLGIIILMAIFALKVIPVVLEYKNAKDAIMAAKATGGTPQEMRITFDKNADINDIDTITGKDLAIAKVADQTEISFRYAKEVPLFTNVSLVIRFAATTDPSGVVPDESEATDKPPK